MFIVMPSLYGKVTKTKEAPSDKVNLVGNQPSISSSQG